MISKDHLIYKEKDRVLSARFISDKGVWLSRCEGLLTDIENFIGKPQHECDDLFKEWIAIGEGGVLLRRGLLQTLQKKITWEDINSEQWEKERLKTLLDSAHHWRSSSCLDNTLQALQTKNSNFEPEVPCLYGDLPQYRKLLHFPNWKPQQWIQRYNLALAQGILLHAQAMDWILKDLHLEKLRFLFRYLKFFGLYYRVLKQNEPHLTLRIEGPLELFTGSKRYRLKMASAAGILPQLGEFEVRAKLDTAISSSTFVWSNKDKLKSHYQKFYDYVSPERRQFEDKLQDWLKMSTVSLIEIPLSMSALMKDHIPDYRMSNNQGEQLNIHIYENHQKNMLLQRKPNPKDHTILIIEKGLKESISHLSNETLIIFNKVPRFSHLKAELKKLNFN